MFICRRSVLVGLSVARRLHLTLASPPLLGSSETHWGALWSWLRVWHQAQQQKQEAGNQHSLTTLKHYELQSEVAEQRALTMARERWAADLAWKQN